MDRSLRVLRLTSVFEAPLPPAERAAGGFDPVGGLQSHAGELSRSLDRLGVSQEIVTAFRPGAPSRESLGRRGHVTRVGLPVRVLRQLYALPARREAMRLGGDVDLIHAHQGEDLAVLPIAAEVARLHQLPLVVTLHCSLRHTLRPVDVRTAILRWVGGAIEQRLTRRAAAVVALSKRLAELTVAGGAHPSRVWVIPPGVDAGTFDAKYEDPLPSETGKRVVFVGRLVGAKGVDLLLRAFVGCGIAGAHLVFVGDGPLRAALLEGARRAGVADSVHVTGFVEPSEVAAHLAHADVAVLPSRFEELGRALTEAMHMGVPVVASRTGGIPEIVDHERTGLLVQPGDTAALEGAIRRVLSEPLLHRRLRAGALAATRQPSWDVIAAEHLRLYRALVRTGPARADRDASGSDAVPSSRT